MSLIKKGLKKVLGIKSSKSKVEIKEVHHHHYHSKKGDPEPEKVTKKCSKCDGKGYVLKWETIPYAGTGYFRNECPKCEGKKYIVKYSFED